MKRATSGGKGGDRLIQVPLNAVSDPFNAGPEWRRNSLTTKVKMRLEWRGEEPSKSLDVDPGGVGTEP